ncbi:MAG TPA: cation-transporting P-type ATPase [Acidimicrobiales bacterium]|nr:cation-transporting P-type ATPase [Acidimicrobiales bacterium]
MTPTEETAESAVDATEPMARLLRDLRTSPQGLSSREVQRRHVIYGPNELTRHAGHRVWGELLHQFTHPLALLLWAAAGLAWYAGIIAVTVAIVIVIVLNAFFAFLQEMQAERAVEALAGYLPQRSTVVRDGKVDVVAASELVPGDVVIVEEGSRVSADARLLTGTVEIDASTLTGESMPVARSSELTDIDVPLLQARDLVFSGTTCTGGEARAVVVATGMHTELGRIAALSQRVHDEQSPLEHQVRNIAWLIAVIAVAMAVAFMPVATLGGGMSFRVALVLAVGLIAGNVPEGLLPVITLALAMGVRDLVQRGAVVKRLSAVETLGSTDVICTDKTGTLTANHMRVTKLWTSAGERSVSSSSTSIVDETLGDKAFQVMLAVMVACNNSRLGGGSGPEGDPTEIALLEIAARAGTTLTEDERGRRRERLFHFDPGRKLMSTVDHRDDHLWVDTKGAPEALLPRCTSMMRPDGSIVALDDEGRRIELNKVEAAAASGLRVLAAAVRELDAANRLPTDRDEVERDLCLVGLAGMYDPPRPEVADAVARCHSAGVRVVVITGDHPLTAQAISRSVGIGTDESPVVTGQELDSMSEQQLDQLLGRGEEIVFARTSPEAKLRIADALRAEGHIVAMTGDGVNDAPALRRADIGVAMGKSGTDVAREAATMVLSDDNFATIVVAIKAGRRVYDNIRKFIVYIFAHATPEIVPYLVFALARGLVPLPLTVMQLLAFDVGTETLPALALGRERAEQDIMERPPRSRQEGVIRPAMVLRAWLFLGLIAATLEMAAFFYTLLDAGWRPGAPVGVGHHLHHAYLEATTMTFLAMVMSQIGTAFAARTERGSLRSIGVFSNRLLLWGIAFELALSAVFIYVPVFQHVLGTTALPAHFILLTLPFPVIVWGADELRRFLVRRHVAHRLSAGAIGGQLAPS